MMQTAKSVLSTKTFKVIKTNRNALPLQPQTLHHHSTSHRRFIRSNAEDNSPSTSQQDQQQQPSASSSTPPPTTTTEEEPIWVRREREREIIAKEGKDLPFGLYLLLSSFVAIAAIGSVFEYVNKHPLFDVIQPDSPLWAPILALFAITGLPTSGYLFYKAVTSANKEAERMDKLDGMR
jgi:hypothetical protein